MLPNCRPTVVLRVFPVAFEPEIYAATNRGNDMRMICRNTAIVFAFAWLAMIASVPRAEAASAGEINAAVHATLGDFYREVRGSHELVAKAAAVLVFPSVYKAGFWVGGEYGEGALLVHGRTVAYYNDLSASLGFQIGAQARSVIIAFMTPEALHAFRNVDGWKVGVDGSVALITVGVGASIDSSRITHPVVGFIFDGKGLMYNLTLEGSKISRIHRY